MADLLVNTSPGLQDVAYRNWLQNTGYATPTSETVINPDWNSKDPRYADVGLSKGDFIQAMLDAGIPANYLQIYKWYNGDMTKGLANQAINEWTNVGTQETKDAARAAIDSIYMTKYKATPLENNYYQSTKYGMTTDRSVDEINRRWDIVNKRTSDKDKIQTAAGTYSDYNPYARFLKRADNTGA